MDPTRRRFSLIPLTIVTLTVAVLAIGAAATFLPGFLQPRVTPLATLFGCVHSASRARLTVAYLPLDGPGPNTIDLTFSPDGGAVTRGSTRTALTTGQAQKKADSLLAGLDPDRHYVRNYPEFINIWPHELRYRLQCDAEPPIERTWNLSDPERAIDCVYATSRRGWDLELLERKNWRERLQLPTRDCLSRWANTNAFATNTPSEVMLTDLMDAAVTEFGEIAPPPSP